MLVVGGGIWGEALASCLAYNNQLSYRIPVRDLIIDKNILYNTLRNHDVIWTIRAKDYKLLAQYDFQSFLPNNNIWVIASKGVVDGLLISDYLRSIGVTNNISVLGGGTFADELIAQQYTRASVASDDQAVTQQVITKLASTYFHCFASDDIVSTQIMAIFKNIIAWLFGLLDYLQLSNNTKAAIIEVALRELENICQQVTGNNNINLINPAAMGDVMLSAYSKKSRNYFTGYQHLQNQTDGLCYESNNSFDFLEKFFANYHCQSRFFLAIKQISMTNNITQEQVINAIFHEK